MLQVRAKIRYNKRVKGDYFHLALSSAGIAKKAKPGQFVNIKVNDAYEPLLRRPFSIHKVKGANLDILYEVVGKATEILSKKKSGEYLDVIGLLGNGFDYRLPITDYPMPASRQGLPILIAGGMGVAPLVFLAEKLRKSKPLVLIGATTKGKITCEKEFKELGCEVEVATDDGSRGFKGYVSDLLKKILTCLAGRQATYLPRPASPAGGRQAGDLRLSMPAAQNLCSKK